MLLSHFFLRTFRLALFPALAVVLQVSHGESGVLASAGRSKKLSREKDLLSSLQHKFQIQSKFKPQQTGEQSKASLFGIINSEIITQNRMTPYQINQESTVASPSEAAFVSTDSSSDNDSSSMATMEEDQRRMSITEESELEPHIGYKKVLVTGGAGFIGSSVAEFLLERGDDVVIVDEMNDYYDVTMKESNLSRLLTKYGEKRVVVYRGDICDEDFMLGMFENERPQWICHMAARAGVRPSIQDPFVYIHSNIKGTTRLMELAHQFGVKNFVFASSSSVYGGSKSTYFSEDENVDNPVSPYAASKKACELLAYTYHHLYNLNVSALRFFTVYGPRGRPDMAPFKFIDRVSRGLEIQKFGDGTSSRDYTYISDIVDGIVRAIDRPHKYEVFNLGKGDGTSLNEFIDLVQKYTKRDAQIKQLPDQPGDVPYTCADVRKAKRKLGYKASVSFEEGIKRTVEWYNKAHGSGDDFIQICPERQANGLGRAASQVNLQALLSK
jgi:UDP-glucuronate 4-epimerase